MRHLAILVLVTCTAHAQVGPDFAARGREICDLVLAKHIDPPTRSQLLVAGIREMFRADGKATPLGLGRALSDVATPDQFDDALARHRAHLDGEDAELLAAFRQGVARALPGGAEFLPDYEFRARVQIEGNRYVGVGVSLHMDGEWNVPAINGVFKGGPAERAGIRAGDRVLEVDGVSTKGIGLQKFLEYSRAEVGSRLVFRLHHPDDEGPRTVEMIRDVIRRDTVEGLRRDGNERWVHDIGRGVGYLRISHIVASTPHELRKVAPTLKKNGFRALVLDLRGGRDSGDVRHAALAADAFLGDGELGGVQRVGGSRTFRATSDRLFDVPLAILCDRRVRGSAEWFVAALQRSGRATVIGEPSAGYAWEPSLVELGDTGAGFQLATGLMRPRGGRAQIRPDVTFPPRDEREAEKASIITFGRDHLVARLETRGRWL